MDLILTSKRKVEMKQYFLKGVDEPLEFGDTLGFDLAKEENDKSVTKHIECTFTQDIVDLLLAEGVIEEKEVEEEKQEPIDFSDDNSDEETCDICDAIAQIDDTIESIAEITEKIEKELADLKKRVEALEAQKKTEKLFEDEYVALKDYLKRYKDSKKPVEDIFKPLHNWVYDPESTIEIFGFAL